MLLPATFLICRSRILAVVTAVPLVIFLAVYGRFYLPRWPVHTADSAFTVLTYNVLYTNEDVDAVATEIEKHAPDFFGLRELESPMVEAIESHFAERYPYRRVEPNSGFWSRYPILSYETFRLVEGEGTCAQQLVLDVDGCEVNVLSVHPRSPPVYGIPLSDVPALLPKEFPNRDRDADLRGLLLRLEEIEGPLADQNFGYHLPVHGRLDELVDVRPAQPVLCELVPVDLDAQLRDLALGLDLQIGHARHTGDGGRLDHPREDAVSSGAHRILPGTWRSHGVGAVRHLGGFSSRPAATTGPRA